MNARRILATLALPVTLGATAGTMLALSHGHKASAQPIAPVAAPSTTVYVPPTPDVDVSTPLPNLSVKVTPQKQETDYWCGDASGSMVLQSYGITVSQATFAKEAGTTTAGTVITNAAAAMYDSVPGHYWSAQPAGPEQLEADAQGALEEGHALFVGTNADLLPWDHSLPSGHAIVIVGLNPNTNVFTVIDPWQAGTYQIAASALNSSDTWDITPDGL